MLFLPRLVSPLLNPRLLLLSTTTAVLGLHHLSSFTTNPSRHLLRADSLAGLGGESIFRNYESEAKVPVVKGGKLNPGAVRQISSGSIAGLLGGIAVGIFSKPLAFLIGLIILAAQGLESQGIHVIPYGRLQSVFKNTDIRTTLQDNVAFKVAFGSAFALAGFASF